MNILSDLHEGFPASMTSQSFTLLFEECAEYMDSKVLDVVLLAFEVADEAHAGVFRKSGEPYIEHPLAVALWLAKLRVGFECIAAALLHDVVEDTDVSLQKIRNKFGSVIARLVDGVTKFDAVDQADIEDEIVRARVKKQNQQAETFRKLLLTMAEDPRVALIKLADRLHNLRTLDSMRSEKQLAIARETMDIYVPLADRLGISEVKYELQDIAFRYLHPAEYKQLTACIAEEIERKKENTTAAIKAIGQVLARSHLQVEVLPQYKHGYSVYRSYHTASIDMSEVRDLIVFRVITQSLIDCYSALKAIHSQWAPIDSRVRDFIGTPKLNGYRALHTTVFGFDGFFNVQIRTREMQKLADFGPLIAYTEKQLQEDKSQSLNWIRQVQSWQQEMSLSALDFIETVRDDIFKDQIFVFTPNGEVISLPNGSTVLDFAYKIHSDLGSHCAGALISSGNADEHMEDRGYKIVSGDIIRILKDNTITPTIDWMSFAKTKHSHDAIEKYLHEHHITADSPTEQIAMDTKKIHLCMYCEPNPGDDLIATIRGRYITVHRSKCRFVLINQSRSNASRSASAKKTSSSVQTQITWRIAHPPCYRVTLNIYGQDRTGLIYDIADVLAKESINIIRSGAKAIGSLVKALTTVTIEVRDQAQLNHVINRLLWVQGVVHIQRKDCVAH